MAEDVIIRGDLVEYRNAHKCEACQSRGRDCIMRMGAETCLLCSDSGRPCIFERSVRFRGSATRLTWDLILAKTTLVNLDQDNDVTNSEPPNLLTKASGPLGDYDLSRHIPSPGMGFPDIGLFAREPRPVFRTYQPRGTYRASKAQRLWKKVFNILHAVIGFHEAAQFHGTSRGQRRWKKVFTILHALTALHEAAQRYSSGKGSSAPCFQIFDSRMEHVRKRRRYFSEAERQQTARVRTTGACSECREKKRRCNHAFLLSEEERYLQSESPRASSVALEAESAQQVMKRPRDIGAPMQDNSSEAVDKATSSKAIQARSQHSKIKCSQCDEHPEGYRGEHELRRHMERAHAKKRKVWICVDPSGDGTFFSGCRSCQSRKTYNAYYNAAAHLRRAHFNPPSQKKGRQKSTRDDARGGRGGSDYPPMEVLKKYMIEVEIDTVIDNTDTVETETDNDMSTEQWLDGQGGPSDKKNLFVSNSASLDSPLAKLPSKFSVGERLLLWGKGTVRVLHKRQNATQHWEYLVLRSGTYDRLWVPEKDITFEDCR